MRRKYYQPGRTVSPQLHYLVQLHLNVWPRATLHQPTNGFKGTIYIIFFKTRRGNYLISLLKLLTYFEITSTISKLKKPNSNCKALLLDDNFFKYFSFHIVYVIRYNFYTNQFQLSACMEVHTVNSSLFTQALY